MRPAKHGVPVLAIIIVVLACTPAYAGKDEARVLYEAGQLSFKKERYAEAIVLFERAYAEHPSSAFLFNVAQAHKKLGRCREALNFYERYLEQEPATKYRAEVDRHIAGLRAQCPEAVERVEPVEPVEPSQPDPKPPQQDVPALEEIKPHRDAANELSAARVEAPAQTESSVRFVASISGGLAMVIAEPFDVPAQASIAGELGAQFGAGDARFELAARGATSAVPYASMEGAIQGTSRLTELALLGAYVHRITSRLHARAGLGAGANLFSGLAAGNPFSADDGDRSAVVMPSFRAFAEGRWFPIDALFIRATAGCGLAIAPESLLFDGPISNVELAIGAGLML